MSGFAVWFAISCGSSGTSTVDAPHATSLSGSVACGSATCGQGQLCYEQFSGFDAGSNGGTYYYCQPAPSGCIVFDCRGSACPGCALSGCGAYPDLVDIDSIMGRIVECGGV